MAININIPKPVIDYNDLDNKPTLVTDHSQLNLDDGTNPHGTTASDVGAVPYTGATNDVDLGNNDLNAEGIKIKGTGGNGHLNMKHQSSNPSAGGQETVIFAGADGEPRFKNDGNAVEQFASREWVGLQGFQNTPIVVNANITAQNDRVYHVVANATFTDPTPVEGRGYFVVVRFASSCVLGGNSYIAGETIHRIFHSGSWLNIALRPSTYVPISRTINGLDLTTNRTLTTANINDSTNRRYLTDAQLTVIGNTSGTNTGDQTLSGLGGVPTSRNITINGVTQDLSLDRTFQVGFERRSDFVSPYHYSGTAPVGTLNSGTWTIKRVDFTNFGSPVTLTATGSWDDRQTLIYA